MKYITNETNNIAVYIVYIKLLRLLPTLIINIYIYTVELL